MIQDLRFGLRSFLSSPGFTVVTVLTLGLGIAFNITVFGWVNGLLLRPFPGAQNQERLAVLEMSTVEADALERDVLASVPKHFELEGLRPRV